MKNKNYTMNYAHLLPIAFLLELAGIITLITNESVIGPIDIGFTMPSLVSANIQGFALVIAGNLFFIYIIRQMNL